MPNNILLTGQQFCATIPSNATSVVFCNEIAPTGINLTDVSEAQDNGIVAWMDGTAYKVSTQRDGVKVLSNLNSSGMFRGKGNLTSIEFDNLDTSMTEDMSIMFYQCSGFKTLDLSDFNTSNSTNMANMFRDCTSLESIDLSSFNTQNVQSFQSFFNNCGKLSSINFGNNFYTDNATSVGYFFMKCASLKNLDLSSWNTKKSTLFKSMFNQCTELTEVKFGKDFSGDSAENMSHMFYKCGKLTSLDLSNWNTKKVKQFEQMFEECRSLKEIKLGKDFNTDSAESMASMFCYCTQLTDVDVSHFNVENVKDMSAIFVYCQSLKEIDVSNWNPKNCTNMSWLCGECISLETFDASGWGMEKVEELNSMFSNCSNLKYFSTKNWSMNSAKNLRFMFYGCSSFKRLDCEKWNVSNVTTFDHFMAHSRMEEYDVSKWQVTSACTNLNAIFHSTRETYVDVTGWDTSNVIAFNQIFDGMVNLEKVDGLETWNTSNGVCFGEMFHSCGRLKEINLSSFDTRKANTGTPISTNGTTSYGLQDMFTGCGGLEKLILSENFTRFGNGSIGSEYYAYFPTPVSGYWYTIDGIEYDAANVPNLTANTYCASMDIVNDVIWDRDSNKYMHLAALRLYHDLQNVTIDSKLDAIRAEIGNIEEIPLTDIQALFATNA